MYTTLPKKGQAPLVVEMWVTCEPLGCCEGGGKKSSLFEKNNAERNRMRLFFHTRSIWWVDD